MAANSDSPNKSTIRRIWRSVFANRKAADQGLDSVVELQAQMNALLAKLDLDAGVSDINYESSLAVEEIDPESPIR